MGRGRAESEVRVARRAVTALGGVPCLPALALETGTMYLAQRANACSTTSTMRGASTKRPPTYTNCRSRLWCPSSSRHSMPATLSSPPTPPTASTVGWSDGEGVGGVGGHSSGSRLLPASLPNSCAKLCRIVRHRLVCSSTWEPAASERIGDTECCAPWERRQPGGGVDVLA